MQRPRPTHVIETVLLASTACLLAAVAWPIAVGWNSETTEAGAEPATVAALVDPAPATDGARIQIALMLDTSSSMDGLIDQARSQLWRVVNALDSATYHDAAPQLEIALYEYGNDGIEAQDGYIRRVTGFTTELDKVSEALFALRTNGGSEHAGQAIQRGIDELAWRDGDGVLRVLYIAGNETFEQGPVPYAEAVHKAVAKSVVVNTVHCASHDEPGWAEAARLGGGKYFQIDHNQVTQYIAAPQDAEIERLGALINHTYVRFGAEGRLGMENQFAQDNNSMKHGKSSSVQRAVSKGSRYYTNPSWDLIDALDGRHVALEDVDKGSLPAELQGLDEDELSGYIAAKRAERARLQTQLSALAKGRGEFVAAEQQRLSTDGAESLDSAMVRSLSEQAEAAGFTLESE